MQTTNWLVTGGCGFIGSNLTRMLLTERPDVTIINLDALTYAGNTANLSDLSDDQAARHQLVRGDIADPEIVRQVFEAHRPQRVFHLAAESHVDRSLTDASPFIRTNVLGTQVLLAASVEFGVERFVMVSTDEVYGSLGSEGSFTEQSPLDPHSPYSASKASGDLIAKAYHDSFGLDVVITRCSNNYGPYQFPEKLIPLMIKNALAGEPLPVYGEGKNIRDWIHVSDHCRALIAAGDKGRPGEVYNIGARNEWANIDIVKQILSIMDKPESLIQYVEDRAGHDWRYAIDSAKAETELDWEPQKSFNDGLAETVKWYIDHQSWWESILSGEYERFYDEYYSKRLKD